MAWTTPRTWVAGEVPTAAIFNTHLRDQLNYLRSNATASVLTSETTTSATYADLATVGPAVTVTTDVQAIMILYCQLANNTSGGVSINGFAISGATTVAAADAYALAHTIASANQGDWLTASFLITGLTAGSNTFTSKYRVFGGTGTFTLRRITIIPC